MLSPVVGPVLSPVLLAVLFPVLSCPVLSNHVLSSPGWSYHVILLSPCPVLWPCPALPVMSLVLSHLSCSRFCGSACPVLSCRVLCFYLSCPAPSSPFLCCLALSCPVFSCPCLLSPVLAKSRQRVVTIRTLTTSNDMTRAEGADVTSIF